MIQGYRMSLFKSKCSKSKLLNKTKIAEHSEVFYLKFTDSSRQERDAVTVSLGEALHRRDPSHLGKYIINLKFTKYGR